MKRTTTPTHIFIFKNINPTDLTSLTITYTQVDDTCCEPIYNIVLTKTLEDCVIGDGRVSVTLTQEETNLFGIGTVNIQLHAKVNNCVQQSNIIRTFCWEVMNDGVI